MLEKESLWQTTRRCHQVLDEADLPHAICGGVAVCLHGYQRNTVDVDLLIGRDHAQRTRGVLERAGLAWDEDKRQFTSASGVPVQLLLGGDRAGHPCEVYLPEPTWPDVIEVIEDLPVLSLAKLLECNIACGEGNVRRTHKDFADVVELIAVQKLDASYARYLHKSLRKTFRELARCAEGDEQT